MGSEQLLYSSTSEESSEQTHTQVIANNMAAVFADQIRKGVCPWHVVPKALRPIVQTLLDRGE